LEEKCTQIQTGEMMNNTLPLWEIQEIKDETVQNNIPIWALIIGALAAFVGLLILPKNQFVGTLVIITSFIPTVIGVNRHLEIRINRKILEHIGVDEGHPWHPADEGESTKTRVKDVLGRWVELPLTANITFDFNQVTNESILIDDEDEKIMQLGTHLTEKEGKKMEFFINQALILSRTQEFEHDPTLKDARIREMEAESLLDREWLDTSPGQVEIEFGQMSRAKEILGKKKNITHSGLDAEE